MTSKHYPFPLLDIAEVIQHFKQEMPNLNLSQADFVSPKGDRWQDIFTMVLESVIDVPSDQLLQPSLELMGNLPYPDLMENTLPLCTLSLYMQRIMVACGIDDFTLRDIIEPQSNRLLRNMSAIINFCFFRTDRLEFYQSIKEQNAAQLRMRDTIMKENMDIKAEINRIRSKRAMQEPAVKELEGKNNELRSVLATVGEKSANKKKALSETNTRIAEKRAKLADLKDRVAAAKEEGNRLSQQIVQSPDRMKENMRRMAKQLEQLRIGKEDLNARLVEQQQMKEDLEQIQNFCDQVLDLTSKITTEVDVHKEKNREIQALRDRVVEKREELHDLETQEQQVKRLITSKQEKLAKMRLTQNNKKQSQENTIQLLLEEKDILSAKQTESAEQKAVVFSAIRELELSEDADRRRHEELMAHMTEKYASILEQLEVYHSKLTEACTKLRTLGK